MTSVSTYSSVPYLSAEQRNAVVDALQQSLFALNDLHLTLKHVHWNVEGPNFIGVHEMLDPQIEDVRTMADGVAERIAMLGGVPDGRSGALVNGRKWKEYDLGRADSAKHLDALAKYFDEIINVEHHASEVAGENGDDVTAGLVQSQLEELEKYHWFVRAHVGTK